MNATRGYKKGSILKGIDEMAVGNLVEEREHGPRIFKILANCMEHTKPVKQTKIEGKIIPNPKFLKILIEDFKFTEEEAAKALI